MRLIDEVTVIIYPAPYADILCPMLNFFSVFLSIISGFLQNIFLFFFKFCQIILIGKNFLKTENFNRKHNFFLVLAVIGLTSLDFLLIFRKEAGREFSRKSPFATWVACIVSSFAGSLICNPLLGKKNQILFFFHCFWAAWLRMDIQPTHKPTPTC